MPSDRTDDDANAVASTENVALRLGELRLGGLELARHGPTGLGATAHLGLERLDLLADVGEVGRRLDLVLAVVAALGEGVLHDRVGEERGDGEERERDEELGQLEHGRVEVEAVPLLDEDADAVRFAAQAPPSIARAARPLAGIQTCLLYTSDAADE